MLIRPKIVPKAWGEELWIHNDEEYCGKILRFFKAGNKFSLHYHILKKESWYVAKGSFEYIWIDTKWKRKTNNYYSRSMHYYR